MSAAATPQLTGAARIRVTGRQISSKCNESYVKYRRLHVNVWKSCNKIMNLISMSRKTTGRIVYTSTLDNGFMSYV